MLIVKKIEIITLHRARNYGSILQAYALQEYIKENGFEVELIDYYPERYHTKGLLKRLKNKSPKFKNPILLLVAKCLILPSYLKKKIVLDPFVKNKLNLTAITYETNEEIIEKLPEADAYCTGSDQVWNSHWNEKVEKCLFLDFVPAGKYCFSYAASFGKKQLDDFEVFETKKLLSKYNAISVRESSGVKICNELGYKAENVADPTMLIDAKKWEEMASNKMKNKRYVLTYNLHHDKKVEMAAKKIASDKGIKVYNISYNWHDIKNFGRLKWCPSIEDFLGLFKNAEYIVADSFHACVFSLLFKKQFIAIYPEVASSRIEDLLTTLSISNRAIDDYRDYQKVYDYIDYDVVSENINNYVSESKSFLREIFKNEF